MGLLVYLLIGLELGCSMIDGRATQIIVWNCGRERATGSALHLSGAGAAYGLETKCEPGSPRFDSCRLCFLLRDVVVVVVVSSRARHTKGLIEMSL